MKLDKYIALSGYTSRRKAKQLIEEKKVTVNGKQGNFTIEIQPNDIVSVEGKVLVVKSFTPIYIVYHKPKGIVCTTEKVEHNIIDAIGHTEKIFPVGRLDKDSEGLILLTNHGEIINQIANSQYAHEKEYIVTLNLPLRKQFMEAVSNGMNLQGEKTKPCKVTPEPGAKRIFRIILTQGLNRQIRRMCNAFDYQVIKLQRVKVMNIELGKLKIGEWRDLREEELTKLFSSLK